MAERKNKMKYIFLDLQGVMDCGEDRKADNVEMSELLYISDRTLSLLKTLVDETKAEIIITSELRRNIAAKRYLWNRFNKFGLEWQSETPNIPSGTKTDEIKHVIGDFDCDITKFVVLDDASLELENLVKTDFWFGVQQEHIEKAVEILT